jgi:hypothetical protein
MERATSERLANLRLQLTYCDDSHRDFEIRCRVQTEIDHILAGDDKVMLRNELPDDIEVRMMDLNDMLKLKKVELLNAPAEKRDAITQDIGRIRLAIATDKEIRAVAPVPGNKPCGASADAENRESRAALVSEDQEQWKFEAERRLASVPKNE